MLDELYRQNLISDTKRTYFAGSCTRSEAEAAHLSPDPAVRSTQIAALFMQRDQAVEGAIRIAVTSQYYLSRDLSPSKRASYIRRTTTKARDWAIR